MQTVPLRRPGIPIKNVGAVSGVRQKLDFFVSLNPDCTSEGYASVVPATNPAHGSVEVIHGSDFPPYPPSNPRSACNTRRVPTTQISYTSEVGYHGPDTFAVTVVTPTGQRGAEVFNIFVQ